MAVKHRVGLLPRPSRRLLWIAVPVVVALMVLSIVAPSLNRPPSDLTKEDLRSLSEEALEAEKLRQEILQLQFENERRNTFWELVPSYATFITAIGAALGVIVTIWKQIDQQEADRRQRETESLRRLDEKFTSIVTDLGSEHEAIQAAAAVSIVSFLRPDYRAFHHQVFTILLANLKLEHSDIINGLLIQAFEKAVRIRLESAKEEGELFRLDLSHANAYRIDLSELDLREADLGFAKLQSADLTDADLYRARGWKANLDNARLSRANLEECRLRRARCSGAQFHNARLVSADLRETTLTEAQFYQAKMQSAHLDGATLNGARFEQADLNDTFFRGASLDGGALRSIVKAVNWQKAHFDEDVKAKLEELAADDG